MEILGCLLAGLLLFLLALVLCPVRYRVEFSRAGGFAEISLLLGLYKKRKTVSAKKAAAETRPERGAAPVKLEKETPVELDADGKPLTAETPRTEEAMETKPEPARGGETPPEKAPEPVKENRVDISPRENKNEDGNEETKKSSRPSAASIFWFAWKNGTVRLALAALGKILRHTAPGEFSVEGRAGLGNPADTGIAAGLCAAALPTACRVEWDYTEKCADLTVKARGRAIPLYVLYLAAALALKRPVRETMRVAVKSE